VGPLIFGEVAQMFNMRVAMLSVGILFLLGIVLVLRVPDVRAGEERGERREERG